MPQTTSSNKKSNWQKYWPVGLVIALVLIGGYLAAGSSWFESQASRSGANSVIIGNPPNSRPVETVSPPYVREPDTRNAYQPRSADPTAVERAVVKNTDYGSVTLASERQRLNRDFQVSTAYSADLSELDYAVHGPIGGYGLQHVSYRRVSTPASCQATASDRGWQVANFNDRRLDRPSALTADGQATDWWYVNSIILSNQDLDQHYCFRVRLTRNRNEIVERYFATQYPIALPANDVISAGDTILVTKAQVVTTAVFNKHTYGDDLDDDDWNNVNDPRRARKITIPANRQRYLNDNFHVWSAYDDRYYPTYQVGIDVPGKHAQHGAFAIHDAIRYVAVANSSQCNEALFADFSVGQTIYAAENEFFLETIGNHKYCVRVMLERQDSSDHSVQEFPMRIFLLDNQPARSLANSNSSPMRTLARGVHNYNTVVGDNQPTAYERRVYADTLGDVRGQLQLIESQTRSGLQFKVFLPHTSFSNEPNADYEINYNVAHVAAGKVNRVSDCNFANFANLKHEALSTNFFDRWLSFQTDLSPADRGARYCFKVQLNSVVEPRGLSHGNVVRYQPEFMFVMRRGLGIQPTN